MSPAKYLASISSNSWSALAAAPRYPLSDRKVNLENGTQDNEPEENNNQAAYLFAQAYPAQKITHKRILPREIFCETHRVHALPILTSITAV